MKIKCPECGKKVSDDLSSCPNCNAVLYESAFGDISAEIDYELSNVTQADLEKVQKEMSGSKAKMSFSEFREFFIHESGMKPPLLPKSRAAYESMLTAQYNNYLRNFGK